MGLLYPTMTPRETERYIELMAEAARKSDEWQRTKDYRDYYRGAHPVFLDDRQEEFLGSLLTGKAHPPVFNLCAPVVDVLRERLIVEGFTGKEADGEALAEEVWEWWQAGAMNERQITVTRRAIRDGAAYLIVDWDAEHGRPSWVPNRKYDGKEGITYYRDQQTDVPKMACKYWTEYDVLGPKYQTNYRTVYLPDRIMRYVQEPGGAFGWRLLEPSDNQGPGLVWWTDNGQAGGKALGVACIEFRNPGGVSELANIIGLQNGLNKTLLDLFAAADHTGFNVFTATYPENAPPEPADDEEATDDDIQIAPGRLLEIFNGGVLGSIPAGDLSQLIAAINLITGAMAGVSRTPQYYLRPFGGSDVPSGESLKQLESALVSRAKERQVLFGNAWVEAARMAARVYRRQGFAGPDPEAQIETDWQDPSVRNELFQAQVAAAEQALGVPEEHLWAARLGYSPDDIKRFKALNAEKQAANVAAVLTGMMTGGGNGNQPGSAQGANGNGQPEPGAGGLAGNAGGYVGGAAGSISAGSA